MEDSEKEITMKIDGIAVNAKEGTSIYDVAKKVGVKIPTLCHNEALEPFGACRVCSVEITDKRKKKDCNFLQLPGFRWTRS